MIRVSKDQVEILSDLGYVFSIPKSEFIDDCDYEVPYLEDVREWLVNKGIEVNISSYNTNTADLRYQCVVMRKNDDQDVYFVCNLVSYDDALSFGVTAGLNKLNK